LGKLQISNHKNQTKIETWDLFGPILRSSGAWDFGILILNIKEPSYFHSGNIWLLFVLNKG
jgi:hypothetical protein